MLASLSSLITRNGGGSLSQIENSATTASQVFVSFSQSTQLRLAAWIIKRGLIEFSWTVSRMEGCYRVEENVNFEAFLRVMGVTDEAQMEKMIAATKQVTLTDNGDGTWTQVSGLKTSTFPINKEYTVRQLWYDDTFSSFSKERSTEDFLFTRLVLWYSWIDKTGIGTLLPFSRWRWY